MSPENMNWRLWAELAVDEFGALQPMHLGSTAVLHAFAVDALYWNPCVPCPCTKVLTPRLADITQSLGLEAWQIRHFVQNVHAHTSQFYLGTGRVQYSPTGHAEEAYILTLDDAKSINETVCLGHEPIFARVQTWLSGALIEWVSQRTRVCIPCDDAKVDRIITTYETSANATLNNIVARAAFCGKAPMRAYTHVHEVRNERESLMVVDICLQVKTE